MTINKLTPTEHAILYFESSSNVYRRHPDIKPQELDRLVRVEMYSMSRSYARELISKFLLSLQTIYHGDALMIKDEN